MAVVSRSAYRYCSVRVYKKKVKERPRCICFRTRVLTHTASGLAAQTSKTSGLRFGAELSRSADRVCSVIVYINKNIE